MAHLARILVVEDEAIEALDIQQRLEGIGYHVAGVAYSGEEGLSKAEELSPDLVLMDIMLPGKLDGVMTAEQIRSRLDIPIIYLTAYADEDTLQRAKITEPYAYLVKPFQERELHIAIDMALYKHKVEKKLRESEQWFSTTLKSIGDAVIATDRDGLVTFMNPVAESLTGWPLELAVNKKLTDVFKIVNRDTRQPVDNPVGRVLREGNVVGLANSTILIARDGAERPIDDRAAPIKDDTGNLVGVVLVFRDVTERERVQHIKDNFISMVSHELKTPLTIIMGALNVLSNEGLSQEQAAELLQDAVSSANTMAAIVENLLELSRSQANRLLLLREPADVIKIARDVVRKLHSKSTIHRLTIDSPPEPTFVLADKVRVERIFHNLIENAIKYSPKGGEVRVWLRREGDYLVVGVRDQGIGISERDQAKLFESFERLGVQIEGRSIQGTGLGLRVCRILVEAHGGQIWIESEPGKGSTFFFTLPLANKADEQNASQGAHVASR
ncbi:MAG: response regulator [Chloroflexi bacterium]|nr:response regulator [Chloroflexota bacterium]